MKRIIKFKCGIEIDSETTHDEVIEALTDFIESKGWALDYSISTEIEVNKR